MLKCKECSATFAEGSDTGSLVAGGASSVQSWVAEYDYDAGWDAGDADEVSFKEGDILINVESAGDGWVNATVESTGASGMAPSNYIKEA